MWRSVSSPLLPCWVCLCLVPGISFKKLTWLSIWQISQLSVISHYGDTLPDTVTQLFQNLRGMRGTVWEPTQTPRFYFFWKAFPINHFSSSYPHNIFYFHTSLYNRFTMLVTCSTTAPGKLQRLGPISHLYITVQNLTECFANSKTSKRLLNELNWIELLLCHVIFMCSFKLIFNVYFLEFPSWLKAVEYTYSFFSHPVDHSV